MYVTVPPIEPVGMSLGGAVQILFIWYSLVVVELKNESFDEEIITNLRAVKMAEKLTNVDFFQKYRPCCSYVNFH